MLSRSMKIILSALLTLSLACGSDDNSDDSVAGAAGMGGEAGSAGQGGGEAGSAGQGGGEAGSEDCVPGDPDTVDGDTYAFDAKFGGEGDSTSYSGQIGRHALISALKDYIGGLETAIAMDSATATTVADSLNFMYTCSSDLNDDGQIGEGETGLCDGDAHGISTDLEAEQTTFGDISGGKYISGKIAGGDATGQSTDWNTDGIVGWGDAEVVTPDGLVTTWFSMIVDNSVNIADGTFGQTPGGEDITKPYVTAQGHDLAQLVHKFLLGAVAFSQGADDYTDYDETDVFGIDLVAGKKGLYADNTALKEGKNYTALEHGWDEGFGYFGAAADYLAYTDDEIAGKDGRANYQGHHDTNSDCKIDLVSEYNWGHSLNAAKRDRGHTTDLTAEAFGAFHAGRALIASVQGELTEAQMTELKGYSDTAVTAWEKAIAATVIHYINDTIGDMEAAEYNFYDHAKHWSELKGFALSFQFNRRSPMTAAQFAALHAAIGTAPALPGAGNFDAYKQGLVDIRGVVGTVYGFDATDVETW
jgi:hypothetical protein